MFRLLIVEDEENSRNGLKNILLSIPSLEIVTACDGREGYHKAVQLSPHMIISDIRMPIWDGLTMIEKLHQQNYNGIIYLLTGFAEFEYAQKALHFHVTEYILKPIVPYQIKKMIEENIKELQKKKNYQNPQICHLVTEEDVDSLQYKLSGHSYTDFFLAVIYMEQERHLPLKVKESILKEPHQYILTLPDMHYRGLIIGFSKNNVNYAAIDLLSSLLHGYENLTCVYQIAGANAMTDWAVTYEHLQNAIPWSMTYQSSFLAYSSLMEIDAGDYKEDDFFHKDLKKLLCNGNCLAYSKLLLKKIQHMQKNSCHPKLILMTAISGLVKLDSKQAYIEAVNQLSSAKTIHEITTCIETYFSTPASLLYGEKYSKLIQRALLEIEKNYKEPITLNSTADKLGITPQYLSRLFMKETARSFIDYLTFYRMEKAKCLLQNTTMKINVVCNNVGYPDAKYFCTLFKKETGVTPNQYRSSTSSF